MDCKYYFKGELIGDFIQLMAKLDNKNVSVFNSFSDIVFSKDNKAEALGRQLKQLKEDYIKEYKEQESSKSNLESFDDDLSGNPNGVSAQEILDDPRCVVDGHPIVQLLNKLDYIRVEAQNIMKKNNWEEDKTEEAIKLVEENIKNKEKIKESSIVLHKIIDSGYVTDSESKFLEQVYPKTEDSVFYNNTEVLKSINRQMKDFMHKAWGDDWIKINNLGIKAKAFGTNIFGHIDYLFIDDHGGLHMYVFKASADPYYMWSDLKLEKYKQYLAFLKQMLNLNGINTSDIELNIVPVVMHFSDDYESLNGITIGDPKNISVDPRGNDLMEKYDKYARFFIKSNIQIPSVSSSDYDKATNICQMIAPNANLREDGVHKSVDEIIKNAPDSGEAEPYTINRLPEGNYRVTINGEEFITKSTKPKLYNEELYKIIEKHVLSLTDNKQQTTKTLKKAIQTIKKEMEKGNMNALEELGNNKGLSANSIFLQGILAPYFNNYDKEGNSIIFNWEIIDDLLDFNILLIHSLDGSDLLDVITLSPYHPRAIIDFHNGTNTIVGRYRTDTEAYGLLANTYGNLEALRTTLYLNELLPRLSNKFKLGSIKVISHLGSAQEFSIADITRNHLSKILKIVKDEEGLEVTNNFKALTSDDFIDPINLVAREYANITANMREAAVEEYGEGKFQELFNSLESHDKSVKVVALRNLLDYFGNLPGIKNLNPKLIIDNAEKGNKDCRMYLSISSALHYYEGTTPKYEEKLGDMDKRASTTTHVGNENIRVITENAAIVFNSIPSETEEYHSRFLRDIIRDYQKAKGYTITRNAVIGDELNIYKHLYELDDQGNKTMYFKNPYTDPSLDNADRQFLRKVILLLYIIRNDFNNKHNLDLENLELFIAEHPDMLWVPLCRAESSTKVMLNFDTKTWSGRFKRMINVIKSPKRWLDEFVAQLSELERRFYLEDMEHLSIRNPFTMGEDYLNRQRYIAEEGIDYFETNIDNILVNYLYQHIKTRKLNDYLVTAKSFIVLMELIGKNSGYDKEIQKQLDYVQDFLKVNVYNESIKDPFGRYLCGLLTPLRTQTTLINLGGNLISFFRDVFQGLQENFMRSVTKLNTDLEAKYIALAYKYVVTHGMTNSMNIDMLSKLQTKYRLSNIDLASAESLKLGRGGVVNYKNWAYSTLRRPDFLNRMTLFVARCMQDGVWEAYSIKDDLLVYDWKKDKRFLALIDGTSKDTDEYRHAKALYMSKIREWNEEHPNNLIPLSPENEEEGLPAPYSDKEILAIKGVSDNIYGAYDKVLKSMMEHGTIMWFFGMYTTWMNGIYSNYFMKPGRYNTTRVESVLETDEAGNLLFWDEDYRITTKDTGMPVYHNIPTITQGIFYTIRELWNLGNSEKGWKYAYDFMRATPQHKANMRKFLSDLLMFALVIGILKLFVLDPSYKDYKKEMKNNPVTLNLLAEVMYKSSTRSWDSFLGPWNYFSWLFLNNDAPIYLVNTRIIKDLAKVVYTDKTLADAVIGNFAFTRIGTDTYSAWKKTQE